MLLPRVTGERVTRELDWFVRRDGSMFPVSYVSVPLVMTDGRGAVVALTDIEDQLRAELELRERSEMLAAEQAAHRRIAALVARGVPAPELLAAVASEVGVLLGIDATYIGRYENVAASLVATWSRDGKEIPLGARVAPGARTSARSYSGEEPRAGTPSATSVATRRSAACSSAYRGRPRPSSATSWLHARGSAGHGTRQGDRVSTGAGGPVLTTPPTH
jgi:hypothetical protein